MKSHLSNHACVQNQIEMQARSEQIFKSKLAQCHFGLLAVLGVWYIWIPHACTCLPALEKRWGQAPKSFCQAKYQINIIMTAHSYFNSYFTRNHHDHINFVPNVLIIFISSVTTYRTPHISTEIPQVTIYHFYWIVLKLLPTLQSFFSDLVATLDIVIILCYLYYFSRLFYIF